MIVATSASSTWLSSKNIFGGKIMLQGAKQVFKRTRSRGKGPQGQSLRPGSCGLTKL
jgi:hypothetical protein